MSLSRVSIIINTFNRVATLKNTLAALERLAGPDSAGPDSAEPDFEVIVVNGPSTDGTAAYLAGLAGRIRVASCPDANLARSRNIGLAHAAGDVVAFIDDDAVPHPAWLANVLPHYRDPAVGGVGGFTVGRNGVAFQAQKIVCNRYGDAHYVSRYFDERMISRPGSWIYPALLGTNATFRRSALAAIGGFDETFAYFLEETDVCLRLVDVGWQVRFEPAALVWHQYAGSHLRNDRTVPSSLTQIVRSKAYFVMRHGCRPWTLAAAAAAVARLDELAREYADNIKTITDNGEIASRDQARLEREVREGMADGTRLAQLQLDKTGGDWTGGDWTGGTEPVAFKAFQQHPGQHLGGQRPLNIALVSHGLPPHDESGIARWTWLLAEGLAARGHSVHILTKARGAPAIAFRDGIWVHEIEAAADGFHWLVERYDVPDETAAWAAAVRRHVTALTSFRLDGLSFPIWDLQGIGCLDLPLPVMMSLHTTYALARPFKDEWAVRPVFRETFVARVVAAERQLLASVPLLLANSQAIITDVEAAYGVTIGDRAVIVPHGTPLPVPADTARRVRAGAKLRVLFVGRFEARKGVDLALAAIAKAHSRRVPLEATFIGGALESLPPAAADPAVQTLIRNKVIRFPGEVSRRALEQAYASHDVVLMPSRYESFGLVAIEAMAHGCPVIALDAGGLAEVVAHGTTGYLVAPGDGAPDVMAAHLVELAADPERLAALSAAATAAVASRYSVDAMAAAMEAVLLHHLIPSVKRLDRRY
jgi:glycosyltransferase involved in cell wall biosynthesis/GT2 family glycosyltransferase